MAPALTWAQRASKEINRYRQSLLILVGAETDLGEGVLAGNQGGRGI